MIKIKCLFIIFLLICIIYSSPVIKAQTETFEGFLYIQSNPELEYTHEINLANQSDSRYTNYNATIKPFIDNNTDLVGRVISGLTFPHVFNLNNTDSITTGSFFRMDRDLIMSGISEFWVRLPVENLTGSAIITTRLYRSWVSGLTFNVTIGADGEPTFTDPDSTHLIFNMSESINEVNRDYYDYIRTSNITVLGTELNYTWFKVTAPILPEEDYYLYFNITGINSEVRICYTGADFANDNTYRSWIDYNGENIAEYIDLDTPMIAVYGMGEGIAGAKCDIIDNTYNRTYFFHNKTIGRVITNATGEYLNFIFPYQTNASINVTFGAVIYQNASILKISTPILKQNVLGRDFIVGNINLSSEIPVGGLFVTHVAVYIWTNSTNANNLFIYIESQDDIETVYTNTINYYHNGTGTDYRFISEYGGFAWYGYLEFENSFWVNVDIEKVFGQEDLQLTRQQQFVLGLCYALFGFWGADVVVITFSLANWYLSETVAGQAILAAAVYLYENVWVPLKAAATRFGRSLISFGVFVWDIITAIVDAIIWLGFLTMKMFYAVIVLLIYFICITSIFLVCEAITVGLKLYPNGGLKAFQDEINKGWPRLYFLINTLFSVIILILVIINSIYNFVKVW